MCSLFRLFSIPFLFDYYQCHRRPDRIYCSYLSSYNFFQAIKSIGSDFCDYIINPIYFVNFHYSWHILQFVYELLFGSNFIINQNICCWHFSDGTSAAVYICLLLRGGLERPSSLFSRIYCFYQMICHKYYPYVVYLLYFWLKTEWRFPASTNNM